MDIYIHQHADIYFISRVLQNHKNTFSPVLAVEKFRTFYEIKIVYICQWLAKCRVQHAARSLCPPRFTRSLPKFRIAMRKKVSQIFGSKFKQCDEDEEHNISCCCCSCCSHCYCVSNGNVSLGAEFEFEIEHTHAHRRTHNVVCLCANKSIKMQLPRITRNE